MAGATRRADDPGTRALDARLLVRADLGAIDELAHAALVARRASRRPVVTNAPAELRRLLELVGLAEALPCV